jgi:hypothetical protein
MTNLQENKTYKLLLQKSEEYSWTKEKVKMPKVAEIRELLQIVGIDTNEITDNTLLQAGKYSYQLPSGIYVHGWNIEINTKEGYYSRNTPYHAKDILKYISEYKSKN